MRVSKVRYRKLFMRYSYNQLKKYKRASYKTDYWWHGKGYLYDVYIIDIKPKQDRECKKHHYKKSNRIYLNKL